MYENRPKTSSKTSKFRRFFGAIGRGITWLRVVLGNMIFLCLLVVLFVTLSHKAPVPLPDEFALRLAPTGFLVDEKRYTDPLALMFQDDDPAQAETLVRDLVDAIDRARDDPRVTALLLDLNDFMGGGVSKMDEVAAALRRFREANKPLIASSDFYSQNQYYLASHADEILLHPMGGVLLTGYGNYRPYFKEALDKLAINFHIFRVGQYKDAVEPFMRNSMSQASREHNQEWLNQLWGQYTSRVEAQRQLPSGAINTYIEQLDQQLQAMDGNAAQLAQETGLVTQILDHRQRRDKFTQRFGESPFGHAFNAVNHRAYLAQSQPQTTSDKGKVALLVASGTIVDGQAPEGGIGSETFIQRLQQVREDDQIKALVVRIDSGGGSAFASEVIRAELEALRQEGMPVLVSMGSIAASGGYWMAMGADEVWATPTSLTGSIGVFGAIPTFEDSLELLGIQVDGVGTTDLAGALRPDRALNPKAETLIQQSVNRIYRQFIELVSQARGLEPERVHQIAQGRVWTGARARELGLVDQLGSLEEVIAQAAERAQLDEYQLLPISRPLSPFEQLLRQLQDSRVAAYLPRVQSPEWLPDNIKRDLSPLLAPLRALGDMDDKRAIYARCLVCVAP